ncbi:MAG: hypothetical protein FWC46_01335 [Actinomycetia bacterium]|nr:hypothetical protein [Actinomycetes bacterium]
MVGLLVRLQLKLTARQFRGNGLMVVTTVVTGLAVLGLATILVLGLVALRDVDAEVRTTFTVLGFALLTLAWPLTTVFLSGANDLLDMGRFAPYPVRARRLVPGLLVAGLLGLGGLLTLILDVGLVLAWGGQRITLAAAIAGAALGTVLCLLLARVLAGPLSDFLHRGRLREALFTVVLFLLIIAAAIGVLFASGWLPGWGVTPDTFGRAGTRVAGIVAWTPFGWPWAIPASVAGGAWGAAAGQTALAVGAVGVTGWAWQRQVARGLVSPLVAGGERVHPRTLADRLLPAGPVGAIARRTVRHFRRDPRRLLPLVFGLLGPLIMVFWAYVRAPAGIGGYRELLLAFAPASLAWLVASAIAQDICHDGTALGTQILTGATGADDRWGRALSFLAVFGPLQIVVLVAFAAWNGRWDLLPGVAGAAATMLLGGIGLGSFLGALWQYPPPPPGVSPARRGAAGRGPSWLVAVVGLVVPLVLASPTVLLTWYGAGHADVQWSALGLGVAIGAIALVLGVRAGGRRLDATWPEVLDRLTWRG